MPFRYKTKDEFVSLDEDKKAYYLARLYILRDKKKSDIPYQRRLFSCRNYLRKQDHAILSVLYNFLTDKEEGHYGLPIWEIIPKATIYDQQCRRKQTSPVEQYKQYDMSMVDDILGED